MPAQSRYTYLESEKEEGEWGRRLDRRGKRKEVEKEK